MEVLRAVVVGKIIVVVVGVVVTETMVSPVVKLLKTEVTEIPKVVSGVHVVEVRLMVAVTVLVGTKIVKVMLDGVGVAKLKPVLVAAISKLNTNRRNVKPVRFTEAQPYFFRFRLPSTL